MKKVRVYELAKELDMESKTLLEKLTAGGMNIANIMCTLDEREIAKAKDLLSGSVSPVIEEKRVKPSIIRRRKKVHVEPEQPSEDSEVSEKTEVQQHEPPLEEAVEEPEKEAEIKEPVEDFVVEKDSSVEVDDTFGSLMTTSVFNMEKNPFSFGKVLFFSILIYMISFLVYQLYQKFGEGL